MGLPELLLEELELLDELELLEELELLDELELLLDELDELEDELGSGVGVGAPPHPLIRDDPSRKISEGVETAGFRRILFMSSPKSIFI